MPVGYRHRQRRYIGTRNIRNFEYHSSSSKVFSAVLCNDLIGDTEHFGHIERNSNERTFFYRN